MKWMLEPLVEVSRGYATFSPNILPVCLCESVVNNDLSDRFGRNLLQSTFRCQRRPSSTMAKSLAGTRLWSIV